MCNWRGQWCRRLGLRAQLLLFVILLASYGCQRQPSLDSIYRDAELKFAAGDLPAALRQAERGGKESAEKDFVWRFKFTVLKAEILIWLSEPKQSLDLLEPEPPTVLSSGEFAIRRKIAQGRALGYVREFQQAQSHLAEARVLAQAQEPKLLADVAIALGTVLFDEGDYPGAEKSFQQALSLARQYHQPLLEARSLVNFGRVLVKRERYDEAIDSLTQSLAMLRDLGARNIEAAALHNLGWAYVELGDFEKAISLFSNAEQIATELSLKQYRMSTLVEMGNVYLTEANYSAAETHYLRALQIAKAMHDDSSTGVCLNDLAITALATGRSDEAQKYNDEALFLKRKNHDYGSELQSLLTAGKIAAAKKDFFRANVLFSQVIRDTQQQKSLQWQAEGELAKLYATEGRNLRAEAEFQRVLQTLDSVRSSLGRDESRLAFSTTAFDFYSAYITFLTSERKTVKALQVAEFSRARTLAEGLAIQAPKQAEGLQIDSVQRFLKKNNEVVLSYWLANQSSFLWAVTATKIGLFSLPPKQELEEKVQRYRRLLVDSNEPRSTDNIGEELYNLLVRPAEDLIVQRAKIVVIPDGGLDRLNFETLRISSDPPRYWIQDVQIETASSMALLGRSSGKVLTPADKLLLIGDPVQTSSEYPALKHAREEMGKVAAYFPPTQVTFVSGKEATPTLYVSSDPGQFGVIHFVTHGTASQLSPLDSAIILSPDGDGSYKLYARDVVKSQLHADVVIISACYGAGTRAYSSEGLVGLAWAFIRAGAHQVVAGLWEVDDSSAPELMDIFYRELRKGKETGAALRSAKLALLSSGNILSKPYYWGSLQLYLGS